MKTAPERNVRYKTIDGAGKMRISVFVLGDTHTKDVYSFIVSDKSPAEYSSEFKTMNGGIIDRHIRDVEPFGLVREVNQ